MFSEHLSQFISVKKEKFDYKNKTYIFVIIQNFHQEILEKMFPYKTSTIDMIQLVINFMIFFWRLDGCVERHAPVKKLKPKEVKLKNKPWINDQIMKMIKTRNKLFVHKERQPNNANVYKLYNLFRIRINREIRKSKKNYYNSYFDK